MRGGGVVDQSGMKAGLSGANRLRQLAATDLVALTTICRGDQVMGHGQASDCCDGLGVGKEGKHVPCAVLCCAVLGGGCVPVSDGVGG